LLDIKVLLKALRYNAMCNKYWFNTKVVGVTNDYSRTANSNVLLQEFKKTRNDS
jgi:hypothetical protein